MGSKPTRSVTAKDPSTNIAERSLRKRYTDPDDAESSSQRDLLQSRKNVRQKRLSTQEIHDGSKHKMARRATTPPLTDTSIERRRNVGKVMYGSYEIDAWYYSPYPSEFGEHIERLYVCERCLRYMNQEDQLGIHKSRCKSREPPGTLVYVDQDTKIFKVDGKEHKLYCQNLCLMTKLFLDHKTLYYDVEGFTFFVLTTQDSGNRRVDQMVGYFSKEKISYDNYNLACIMTLPTHQRQGYGRLLIELSYELSRREGVIGSPEKPLSSLGLLGYRSCWASIIMAELVNCQNQITIRDLSTKTNIHEEDIIDTLTFLGLLRYWKPGDKHPIHVCVTREMLNDVIKERRIKLNRRLNVACLVLKDNDPI